SCAIASRDAAAGVIATSIEPPQHIARSRTRCWRTTRGAAPAATSRAAATTSCSILPPPTVPHCSPSAATAMRAPRWRGVDPVAPVTAAIATPRPPSSALSAAANTSSRGIPRTLRRRRAERTAAAAGLQRQDVLDDLAQAGALGALGDVRRLVRQLVPP